MSTRLDVRPDAYYVAAQAIASDVVGCAASALDVAGAVLAEGASMAGFDPGGLAWAAEYDRAARTTLIAGQNLVNGAYRVVGLLEQTGVNHERADAASVPGGADTLPRRWLHDPSWTYRAPGPPSAAGGSADPPTGWELVSHLVGYVWPGGHQDRLRAAARAWAQGAERIGSAAEGLLRPWAMINEQFAPEVDAATSTLSALSLHLHDLASAAQSVARSCDELADHIDVVHSAVGRELADLIDESGMLQIAGGVAAAFTLGAAEVPTQVAQAARVAAAALRIGSMIEKFVVAARTVAVTIPPIEEIAAGLSLAMQRLLGARLAYAGVTAAPRLPAVLRAQRLAVEMRAEEGLARGAVFSNRQWARFSEILRRAKTQRGMYRLPAVTRQEADAVGRAWVGPDAHFSNNGNAWISKDGLRQYRPPMIKKGKNMVRANIESRDSPAGEWPNNGHMDITDP